MSAPVRLRLSRKKGFNLHLHSLATNGLPAVRVCRPSKWGNPFPIGGKTIFGVSQTPEVVVERFKEWFVSDSGDAKIARAFLPELRGKNLACFCPLDSPCHADVLLEIANRPAKCEEVKP